MITTVQRSSETKHTQKVTVFLHVCWNLNSKFLIFPINRWKNHPYKYCKHANKYLFNFFVSLTSISKGRKIIFNQAAFLAIDPHGAALPVNFCCWKSVDRPQLSSWVQCHLRSCQWCPVQTYCRHTGACIGFGRIFWN